MLAPGSTSWFRDTRAELLAAIDDAGAGRSTWHTVADLVCDRLPGSFCGINNQNKVTGSLNFGLLQGMPREATDEYALHYSRINPLNAVWNHVGAGGIVETERLMPISTIRETAFYQDFFRKYGDFDIGVGLKVDTDDLDQILMPIHFPTRFAESYSPILRQLLAEIAPAMMRAAELNRLQTKWATGLASASAISTHPDDIALVIDRNLKVVDANSHAHLAFSAGTPLSAPHGRLRIAGNAEAAWLEQEVADLIAGSAGRAGAQFFRTEAALWKVRLFALPEVQAPHGVQLGFARRLVAVIVENVAAASRNDDLAAFGRLCGLTSAELRLCRQLADGLDLAEAAERLGLSRETVRHQLKGIFRKTDTNRQSELIRLLLK